MELLAFLYAINYNLLLHSSLAPMLIIPHILLLHSRLLTSRPNAPSEMWAQQIPKSATVDTLYVTPVKAPSRNTNKRPNMTILYENNRCEVHNLENQLSVVNIDINNKQPIQIMKSRD